MRIERWKVQREMQRVGIKTYQELAAKAGIAPQTLSAWFRGRPFTSDNLDALCRALECTPDSIITMDPKAKALAAELVAV